MMNARVYFFFLFINIVMMAHAQQPAAKTITATTYNSGFDLAHDTYNGLSAASDGKIYYVLSSQSIDIGGKCMLLIPQQVKPNYAGILQKHAEKKISKQLCRGKAM